MAYAIKAEIRDCGAATFAFEARKTMYGGKRIAAGDTIFLFASENEGGSGLVARGVVKAASAVGRRPGVERQTPRVSLEIRRTGTAKRPLGRNELKAYKDWGDEQPGTELNFKLYRQATDKVVGVSDETAEFLEGFFK